MPHPFLLLLDKLLVLLPLALEGLGIIGAPYNTIAALALSLQILVLRVRGPKHPEEPLHGPLVQTGRSRRVVLHSDYLQVRRGSACAVTVATGVMPMYRPSRLCDVGLARKSIPSGTRSQPGYRYGKARPRAKQLEAIAAVRGIGKREALRRLEALHG